jgi:hypothetical protein
VGRRAGRPPSTAVGSHGSLALLLGELPLPALVLGELLDEAGAKDSQGRDQRVELVQRVLALRLRLEVELEPDAVIAVRISSVTFGSKVTDP